MRAFQRKHPCHPSAGSRTWRAGWGNRHEVRTVRTWLIAAIPVVALACGSLVTPPAASAAPVTAEEFKAALSAATDASAVLTKGTTVSLTHFECCGDEAPTRMTVNPNGSRVLNAPDGGGRLSIRCTRVDRCWERSEPAYGDRKWHRLPEGAVTYEQVRGQWWDRFVDFDWGLDATYDVSELSDGSRTFAAVVPDSNGVLTGTFVVSGGRLAMRADLAEDGGRPTLVLSVELSSRNEPLVVSAPARSAMGRPAPKGTTWVATAYVNN